MADRLGPTLINLPSPSSGMATPSDAGPSTPGSTTTSVSALSTIAIKDGHIGNNPQIYPHKPTTSTLAAERADRISRLSGMNDLTAARSPGGLPTQANSYFENPTQSPTAHKSTVGSASASSMKFASTSERDGDERDDLASLGASEATQMSDETTGTGSYVGFGEAAGEMADKTPDELDEMNRMTLRKKKLLQKQQEERGREGKDIPMADI